MSLANPSGGAPAARGGQTGVARPATDAVRDTDLIFMRAALEQARHAYVLGEVPVGAVVVLEGRVIATGCNQPIGEHDPTAHAEIRALRQAAQVLGNYRLPGCELYVTLEPCAMCAGAIQHARIARLVWGAADPKTGACGSVLDLMAERRLNHHCVASGGVLADEAGLLLRDFFAERRRRRAAPLAAGAEGLLGRRPLRGSRLILEPMVAAHAEALWPLLSNPLFDPMGEPPPSSPEWLATVLREQEARRTPDGRRVLLDWAIRAIDDGTYLGRAQATVTGERQATLRCAIAPARRRQGQAAEALACVMAALREEMGVERVWALAAPGDAAAAALAARLGLAPDSGEAYPLEDRPTAARVFSRQA